MSSSARTLRVITDDDVDEGLNLPTALSRLSLRVARDALVARTGVLAALAAYCLR